MSKKYSFTVLVGKAYTVYCLNLGVQMYLPFCLQMSYIEGISLLYLTEVTGISGGSHWRTDGKE